MCNIVTHSYCRRDKRRFTVVLVGNDALVSCAVQALVTASCSPNILHFVIIPIGKSDTLTHTVHNIVLYNLVGGLMSARLASLDERFLDAFPPEGAWIKALQDGIGKATSLY